MGTRSPTADTRASPPTSGHSGAPVRGDTNPIIAEGVAARPGAAGVTAAIGCSSAYKTDLHRRTRTGTNDPLTRHRRAGYVPYEWPRPPAVAQQGCTSARSQPVWPFVPARTAWAVP